MRDAQARDFSILRLLRAAGGYYCGAFVDAAARDHCVESGWIVAEGEAGYALTVEGACALRARVKLSA